MAAPAGVPALRSAAAGWPVGRSPDGDQRDLLPGPGGLPVAGSAGGLRELYVESEGWLSSPPSVLFRALMARTTGVGSPLSVNGSSCGPASRRRASFMGCGEADLGGRR